MVRNTGWLLAGGLVVGVVAGALGMMSLRGGDGPYASSPLPKSRSAQALPVSTAFVTAVAGNCEMAPMLASAGNGDGQESLQAKPGAASAPEVASLLLSGKEAAASGRQRDAEVQFLNACRNAAALQDGDPIPVADSMYQLARLYANVGALGSPKGKDLYQRAERLYAASLEGYRARYGEDGEKTRFAREGLVTVQQATGGKPPTPIAKAAPAAAAAAPAPVAAASAAPAVPVAAASAPAPAVAATAAAPAASASTAPMAAHTDAVKAATATAKPNPDAARPAPVRRARVPEEPRSSERDAGGDSPVIEQPPSQARRAPGRQESGNGESGAASEAPTPRLPQPVFVAPADAAPSSGAPAQAEGSPNAQ